MPPGQGLKTADEFIKTRKRLSIPDRREWLVQKKSRWVTCAAIYSIFGEAISGGYSTGQSRPCSAENLCAAHKPVNGDAGRPVLKAPVVSFHRVY
jgi:hypothetical protein